MVADDLTFGNSGISKKRTGNSRKCFRPAICSSQGSNSALMDLSPLEHVLEMVKTIHRLEQRLRADAEGFQGHSVTPADRARVDRQLEQFQQTIDTIFERKSTQPQFGTYTFQRLFDAFIAILRDLSTFINSSVAVPPLYPLENSQ